MVLYLVSFISLHARLDRFATAAEVKSDWDFVVGSLPYICTAGDEHSIQLYGSRPRIEDKTSYDLVCRSNKCGQIHFVKSPDGKVWLCSLILQTWYVH